LITLFFLLASTSQVTKSKTKLVVTDKKEYPITTNFPCTLETLVVTAINLKKIDTRSGIDNSRGFLFICNCSFAVF
jgi:hypothetical protein